MEAYGHEIACKGYGCLELGMLKLEKQKRFLSYVSAWNWIDEEEPDESCDILKEMSIPVYVEA